jgi:adenylate cyclase
MANEIERKFLVNIEVLKVILDREQIPSFKIAQGYLLNQIDKTVRVRVKGDKGYLTIKGEQKGITRQEFEYEIPVEEAIELLKMCSDSIHKTRYEFQLGGKIWEIDFFHELNNGLVVAEIELGSENEKVDLPEWITEEVTHDVRYTNAVLVKKPYLNW